MDDRAQEIIDRLDRVLNLLGEGKGKLPSEIKREVAAKILYLKAQDEKRKKRHECAAKG